MVKQIIVLTICSKEMCLFIIMDKLEQYLDSNDNTELNANIFSSCEKFGYTNDMLFRFHLSWLLENCYTIKLTDKQRVRMGQKKFRSGLFKKFNGTCIISRNDCEDELVAAHIVPVADAESYDIDNGLLLTATLHNTMDKLLWAINPKTLTIEIAKGKNIGQISNYAGKKVNLQLNAELEANLMYHWEKFNKAIGFVRSNN
jgi:hypothetical protein